MSDIKQALKDFVATSNSGKYKTEEELMSKFPELKEYDIQALKDFVATSNSGKYKTEDELFSKFPEFSVSNGGASANFTKGSQEPSAQPAKPLQKSGEATEKLTPEQAEGRQAMEAYGVQREQRDRQAVSEATAKAKELSVAEQRAKEIRSELSQLRTEGASAFGDTAKENRRKQLELDKELRSITNIDQREIYNKLTKADEILKAKTDALSAGIKDFEKRKKDYEGQIEEFNSLSKNINGKVSAELDLVNKQYNEKEAASDKRQQELETVRKSLNLYDKEAVDAFNKQLEELDQKRVQDFEEYKTTFDKVVAENKATPEQINLEKQRATLLREKTGLESSFSDLKKQEAYINANYAAVQGAMKSVNYDPRQVAAQIWKENVPLNVSLGVEILGAAKSWGEQFISSMYGSLAATDLTLTPAKIATMNVSDDVKEKLTKAYENDKAQLAEFSQKAMEWSEQSGNTKKTFGLVEDLGQIESPLTAMQYLVGSMTEMGVQLPLAAVTFGTSSYFQSLGAMHTDAVRELMSKGMSMDEALDSIDNDILKASALGVALLDLTGTLTVLGKVPTKAAVNKIKGMVANETLAKIAIAQGTEIGTELLQEGVEAGGKAKAIGDGFWEGVSEIKAEDMVNLAARVFFGVLPFSTISAYSKNPTINKETAQVVKQIAENQSALQVLTERMAMQVQLGEITQQEMDASLAKIQTDIEAYVKLAGMIDDTNLAEALVLQEEYDSLQEQIKEASGAIKPYLQQNAKRVEAQIQKLAGIEINEEGEVVVKKPSQKSEEKGTEQEDDTTPTSEKSEVEATAKTLEGKKADIERRRQEELEGLPFSEDVKARLAFAKEKGHDRYLRELKFQARETEEGRTVLQKHKAEDILEDPNSTLAQRVTAKAHLQNPVFAMNEAMVTNIENDINNEFSTVGAGEVKAYWTNNQKELKAIYDAELAALESKPTPQSEVEATAKTLEGVDITTIISPQQINELNKQLYNNLFDKQKELLSKGIKDFDKNEEVKSIKEQIAFSEALLANDSKAISEAYHKALKDNSNPELVKAVKELLSEKPELGVEKITPTKENVQERLTPESSVFQSIQKGLAKLGLIEPYNPETKEGDIISGEVRTDGSGGFFSGDLHFKESGEITYTNGNFEVEFDSEGNVVYDNTQEVINKNIEDKENRIAALEAERDSEEFKYKTTKEKSPLGSTRTVRRLKTPKELKEDTDKINASIDRVKKALAKYENEVKGIKEAKPELGVEKITPTKENVQERLNINHPFYKKVEDALVKLGLIEKYNPETGTGDIIGGVAQPISSEGGVVVGDMYFYPDGSISYVSSNGTVQFDKNGNVISENTKEVAAKNKENEIEGKKEAIANLEKTRDSENFKYKEVTETDPLGNRKKVRRLKTAQELKESTDKINAAIDKAKSELAALEAATPTTKAEPKAAQPPATKTEQPQVESKAAAARPELESVEETNQATVTTLPISEISQDPARFQYKSDVDPKTGVSEKLKGRKFRPELSGVISVWVDPSDGKTYVINGHHRLDLAKSTGQESIDVRYIQAENAEQARTIGAMQNIAEGQGSDIDAAKIFRQGDLTIDALKDYGLSISDSKTRKGLALANLSDALFDLVVSGKLDANKGVIIGENISSQDVQEQFYNIIKGKNLNNSTIQVMAQDIQAAPKKTEVVVDLFGTTEKEMAEYEQRASLIAGIRDVIGRAKNLLGKTAKGKDFLEEYGNKIDQAKSEGASSEAAEAMAVFDVLRNTSPEISAIINEAFNKIQKGENKKTVTNEAAKRIIEITPKVLGRTDGKDAKASAKAKGVGEQKGVTPTSEKSQVGVEKLSDKIRSLKIDTKGKAFDATLGLPIAIYNTAIDIIATSLDAGMKLQNAIAKAMKYIDSKMEGKKWNKGLFAKEMNVRYSVTLPNGDKVEVERDTSKEAAEVINGWYQPIEQKILDTKQEKLPAKEWANRLRSKEDEDVWTGVRGFLESKGNQSVSKQELLDFMKNNRVEIVEVVKEERLVEYPEFTKEDEKRLAELQKLNDKNPRGAMEDVQEGSFDEFLALLNKKEKSTIEDLTERQEQAERKAQKVQRQLGYKAAEKYWDEANLLTNRMEAVELRNDEELGRVVDDTKHSPYQLEGDKSNYKEVLVTLPSRNELPQGWTVKIRPNITTGTSDRPYGVYNPDGDMKYTAKSEEDAKSILRKYEKVEPKTFQSTHFNEPNILVHLRMNTRTDADGKKVLFLEELQSDWGQKGKKEGFKQDFVKAIKDGENKWDVGGVKILYFEKGVDGKNYRTVNKNGEQEWFNTIEEANKVANETRLDRNRLGTPTAPFVTDTSSWVKLGIKTAIKEAVAQGVDKIAWSTGEQQFDRWGTEKIDWVTTMKPKGGSIIVKDQFKAPIIRGRRTTNLASISEELDPQKEINRIAEKWGLQPSDLEFQVTTGRWTINIQEQFRGTAFEGMSIDEQALSESGTTINSKEELKAAIDRNLSREKTETERQKLTDRIWDRMQKEDSGTSLPRKEGMEGFYDKTVPSIAKAVVKELTGKEGVVGETKIPEGEGIMGKPTVEELAKAKELALKDNDKSSANFLQQQIDRINKGQEHSYALFNPNEPASEYFDKVRQPSVYTQQSIDITPELKASVEKGMPLFGVAKTPEQKLTDAISKWSAEQQKLGIQGQAPFNKADLELVKAIGEYIQEKIQQGYLTLKQAAAMLNERYKATNITFPINDLRPIYVEAAYKALQKQINSAATKARTRDKAEFKKIKDEIVRYAKNLLNVLEAQGVEEIDIKEAKHYITAMQNAQTAYSLNAAKQDLFTYTQKLATDKEAARRLVKIREAARQAKENFKANKFGADQVVKQVVSIPYSAVPDKLLDAYEKIITNLGLKRQANIEIDAAALKDFHEQWTDYLNNEFEEEIEVAAPKQISEAELEKIEEAALDAKILADTMSLANVTNPDIRAMIMYLRDIPLSFYKGRKLAQLRALLSNLSNIENGFEVASALESMVTKHRAIQMAEEVKAKKQTFSKKEKKMLSDKETFIKKISNLGLAYLDEKMKIVNGAPIWEILNNITRKIAGNDELFKANVEQPFNRLVRKIAKKGFASPYNYERLFNSNMKLWMYFTQAMYEANPNEKKVNSLHDQVVKNREKSSLFSNETIELMEKVYGKFVADKGENFTSQQIYETLTPTEKEIVKFVREKLDNDSKAKHSFVNATYANNPLTYFNNYFPTKVVEKDTDPSELVADPKSLTFKGGSAHERTAGLKPLSMDFYSLFLNAMQETYTQYNLTPAYKESVMAFRALAQLYKDEGNIEGERMAQGLGKVVEDIVRLHLEGNRGRMKDSFGESVAKRVLSNAGQLVLTGIRLAGEKISNQAVRLAVADDLVATRRARKKLAKSGVSDKIISRIGTDHASRIGSATIEGFEKLTRIKITLPKGDMATDKAINFINNNLVQDLSTAIYTISQKWSDSLSKDVWETTFLTEFKKAAGKDFNPEAFMNPDDSYLNINDKAIRKAVSMADKKTTFFFNAANRVTRSLLMQTDQAKGVISYVAKWFLKSFTHNENSAMWESLRAITGKGTKMTPLEGWAAFGGLLVRNLTYQAGMSLLWESIYDAVLGEDDEDEDEIMQALEKSSISTLLILAIGRSPAYVQGIVSGVINIAHRLATGKEKYEETGELFKPKNNLVYDPKSAVDFLGGLTVLNSRYEAMRKDINSVLEKHEKGDITTAEMLIQVESLKTVYNITSMLFGLPFDKEFNLLQRKMAMDAEQPFPIDKKRVNNFDVRRQ